MDQKGYSLTPLLLIAATIILVSSIYLISNSRINIKNPLNSNQPNYPSTSSTPSSQPTKTTIPENINCTADEDCGVNICACTAMNKAYIETKNKISLKSRLGTGPVHNLTQITCLIN